MILGKIFALLLFSTGEAPGSPLDVNPGLIIWTLVTVALLLVILKKIAWKPILNSLNERENLIRESLEKAEKARVEAEELFEQNKENLKKSEAEAQKIIEQGRQYADKLREQILEDSKQQSRRMIEEATQEIERKNAEAFSKLKDQVADIAVSAAEKILRENLDKEKQMKIITKYLEDLSKN